MRTRELVKVSGLTVVKQETPVFPFEIKRYLANLGCIADTEPGLINTAIGRTLGECCDQFSTLRHASRWEKKPIAQVYEAFWSYLKECGIPQETIDSLDSLYTKFMDECKKYRGMSFAQRAVAVKQATGGLL